MTHTPRTWLEISKSAINHNLAQYKRIIGKHILAPVIKGNAYGHGFASIGHICQENSNVDWLCVSFLSEALELRRLGITKPILVLSHIDSDPAQAINQDITFIVYDYPIAQYLDTLGKKYTYQFNVHIKIDTGLRRLGIIAHDALPIIEKISGMRYVKIKGLCTHFAESHKDDQTYTQHQLAQFKTILTHLQQQNMFIRFMHAYNSAATMFLTDGMFNFFRVGAGMYGLWPSAEIKNIMKTKNPDFTLKQSLTWKTSIIQIKEIPAASYIGYDRTYITTKPMRIAVIPIGYQDGYNTQLANNGQVMICNTYAPVIGRISMNMTTLDITNIPEAKVGDEVILLGNFPHIRVWDLAQQVGTTNPRNIVACINPTIPSRIMP